MTKTKEVVLEDDFLENGVVALRAFWLMSDGALLSNQPIKTFKARIKR